MFRYCRLQNPVKKPPYGSIIDTRHPLAQGLIGCWAFNEHGGNMAFDCAGQNHFTLYNTDWNVDGVLFNSASDYGRKTNPANIGGFPNGFSITVILTPAALDTRCSFVQHYDTTDNQRAFLVEYEPVDDKIRVFLSGDGVNYYSSQHRNPLEVNKETIFTVTWTPGNFPVLYADGILKNTLHTDGTPTSTIFDSTAPLDIGRSTYSTSRAFPGTIHLVLIHDLILPEILTRSLHNYKYSLFEDPFISYFCDFGAAAPSNIIKVLNDTSSSSDVVKHVLDIAKILSDTSGSSDAVNHALNIINILSDTADSSDAINHVLDITGVLNDSAAGSDVINHVLDIIKVFSDSTGSAETFNHVLDIVKILNNTADSSDAVNHVLGIIRTFLDTTDSSDTVNHALGLIKIFIDTADSSDTLNHVLDIIKAFSDAAISSDTFNHVLDIVKILDETAAGSDTINHVLGIVKTIVDTADSSDVVNHVLGLIKVFSGSAGSSDTINHVIDIIRVLNNTAISSGTVNHVLDIIKIFNNAADSSDTLNHVLDIVKVLNDSAAGSDAVNHVLGLTRTIINSAVSSDTENHVISITGDILTALAEIKSVVDANNVLLTELWRLQGLDISNPMTVTPTSRTVGSISQTISGDGKTITTVTRN